MNKQVDEYIGKQTSPQKEICFQLRGIILGVFPGIEEEMKWGVPTYAKGKFYFVALKDHVNLGFSIEGLSEAEKKRFEGSGKTMKIIKFSSIQEIDETDITNLLRLVWVRQESKTK
jgi:uncharacterized protein YdhG (YjbR/CyaY superfamily)